MTKVYIADCSPFADEQFLARALPLLDPRRRMKIQRLKPPAKKAQSAVAGLLMTEIFGSDAQYFCTESGKPYLLDDRAFFSISHTDRWVALAVSDREIGFDLEVISPIRLSVFCRCFTASEQAWIGDNNERFTQLWVNKEAYAKFTGLGLKAPFVDIVPETNVPKCEGKWGTMYYALYGDDAMEIIQISDPQSLL